MLNPVKKAIVEQAFQILKEEAEKYTFSVTEPKHALAAIKAMIGGEAIEKFGMIFLTNQHQIIAMETLFEGTIDGASVYPREVIKKVLNHNAAAVILFHNHPSGDCTPSQSDKAITEKIRSCLNVIDVRLLDHFIVGFDAHKSFAELGLI